MAGNSFDLVVVGGGPGGYVTAIRAAQLKMRVAVVEREHLGGICLNWGCIPTKALLRSADVLRMMRHAQSYGLSAGDVGYDLAKIVARSRAVAGQLQAGVKHLLKKNGVAVFDGHGRLAGAGKVTVGEGTVLTAPHIILATGARARVLPGLEPDRALIWTYKEALVAAIVPKRLVVVGSGAIGIEFASFFNALGSDVTVIEVMDRILPVEDEEISSTARKSFEKQGMKLLTSAKIASVVKGGQTATVTVEAGGKRQEIVADRIISAVGIVGNVEDIGLEAAGIAVERTHVVVDEWCRTSVPGVYAIGDLAGPPWLAHKASHEGVICVEKIAGLDGVHPLDAGRIPGCTYCHPQVASVGLTERAAKEKGYEVRVGRFPFIGNGKAIALGETEGLVKTVFDAKTGALLGAHMVGAEVTEMIQGYAVAQTLETTEAELMHTVFPHPTLSEMMHESVLDAFGKVIHF
jgi:dihydrolipoamide dehydrogenase